MLELTIIDGLSVDNPTKKVKAFNDQGGVIGRDSKADWPLYDPSRTISSQHVKVIFSQGTYYFSDLSTNGVVSDQGQRLRKGEYRLLKIGEVYSIGAYRIEVTTLNIQDETIPFKEAGLAHILNDAKPEDEMSPLQYAEKQNDPLAEKANQDFPFKQKANTLKAFDFMPEPVDFGKPPASEAETKEEAAIPEIDFLSELQSSSVMNEEHLEQQHSQVQEEVGLDKSFEAPPAPALTPVETNTFTDRFCSLFNLDPKHFNDLDDSHFEKGIKSLFSSMAEKFHTHQL